MSQRIDLDAMTVAELRKYAKEQGVTLSTVTTKAGIITRIEEALGKRSSQTGRENPAPGTDAGRRATIIVDEGDETASPAPLPRPQPDRNRTSTGKIKPAFTLAGSRAWHNPQPFTQTQPQQSRYAPQLGQTVNTLPREAPQQEARAYQPARERPVPPRVSRFGPDVPAAAAEPEVLPERPRFEPRPFQAPAAVPGRTGRYQSGAFRSALPGVSDSVQADAIGTEVPEPAFPAPDSAPEPKTSLAVPDMLATGDCGDGAGILEIQQDGYGFLRASYLLPGRSDVYVSGTQIRRFRLRNGDYIVGKTRPQRENDRYAAMLYITSINGEEAEGAVKLGGSLADVKPRRDFDQLTPTYPDRRIRLSTREENDLVLRLIDLFVPIGFGQRAMIVAAPKTGKTTILKKIALSLKRNHPDVHSMMLLVDERPEEVTDLKETVGGDIFHSTFDEPPENHARVSELTLERAMRLVEMGRDVVILLDSLTRMSRAYNTLMPGSARVMTGGLAAGAMNKPKRFFGAARNLKEGGSLTIIATALVDTGSRMDGVIFEEFKGTGNMELTLDRQLSERRLFPAVSLLRSGTRHDELLLNEREIAVAAKVRERLGSSSEQETVSLLLSMLEKSRDNEEFVAKYDDWMKLMRSGI